MFSNNLKQFGIRHVLVGTVLVGIAMGLISTQWALAVMLGVLILVGLTGGLLSYVMMFISDLVDDRRIDDRNLLSRFLNWVGLLIILATSLAVILLGAAILFQSGYLLLERIP